MARVDLIRSLHDVLQSLLVPQVEFLNDAFSHANKLTFVFVNLYLDKESFAVYLVSL
jgi:hypothetical protein